MLEAANIGFAYKGSAESALQGVSLSVGAGERVCVLGANASGKSTLAGLLAGSLALSEGTIAADGQALVGYVAQDPRSQMVSTLVYDEVAFGARCSDMPRAQVKSRVAAVLDACGIRHLAQRSTSELSGGQQQLVALAAAIAPQPAYLVLDEPVSALDSTTARAVDALIADLAAEGMGIIEFSVSAGRAAGADRVYILDKGTVAWSGSPSELLADDERIASFGLVQAHRGLAGDDGTAAPAASARHTLALDGAGVLYDANAALKDATLALGDELVVVAGRSGSGRSTLAAVLAGVLPADEGSATLDGETLRSGRVGYAPQVPYDALFAKTVRGDIAFGARAKGLAKDAAAKAVESAAASMDIKDALEKRPGELSWGQARRAVCAAIEASAAAACVLDEPLAGLDAAGRAQVKRFVQRMRMQHRPVIVVTNELDEWLGIANRVIFMRRGSVAADCDARTARTSARPYTSSGLTPPAGVAGRRDDRV